MPDTLRPACSTATDDLFFDGERTKEALRLCAQCPQWADCVLGNLHETYGVWGTSERCRRRMRGMAKRGATAVELLTFAADSIRQHAGVDVAQTTSYA